MKRLLVSLILSLVILGVWVLPAYAIVPQGVDYNFNAAENEWALRVRWTGHPNTEVKAGEFYLAKKETTKKEVEARILTEIHDAIVEDILWNQLDPEEEPRLSGVLSPGEEIIYDPQQKLRVWKAFFGLHIYSLDDLETPESELRFVTRFIPRQNVLGGTPYEEIFPDGWWPE